MHSTLGWKRQRKEISDLEDIIEKQKLSNLNNRKKVDWKKVNRASGTYETITKDLTFMLLNPQKVRRKRVWLKYPQIWQINISVQI